MLNFRRFPLLVASLLFSNAYAAGVPDDCTQLIVGLAPDWNSMRGQLQLFERAAGANWTASAPPVPVLFGKNGLAWGSGIAGQNESGLRKTERDGQERRIHESHGCLLISSQGFAPTGTWGQQIQLRPVAYRPAAAIGATPPVRSRSVAPLPTVVCE